MKSSRLDLLLKTKLQNVWYSAVFGIQMFTVHWGSKCRKSEYRKHLKKDKLIASIQMVRLSNARSQFLNGVKPFGCHFV